MLDRRRSGRTFRRIVGAELDLLLSEPVEEVAAAPVEPAGERGPDDAPFEG